MSSNLYHLAYRAIAPESPYFYQPSIWLLATAASLFGTVTLAHLWCLARGGTWCFWAMAVGALMETTGFVARVVSARDFDNSLAFLIQYLMLILAPSFLAAACYVIFGRILWWVTPGEHRTFSTLWCPPSRVSLLFVAFDLASFFVQLLGASSSAQAMNDDSLSAEERRDKREKGLSVMRIGLGLQLICFALFAFVGARFLLVSRRWSDRTLPYGDLHAKWEHLSWTVNGAATLILIRTIYRLFEFSGQGSAPGYVLSHEWLFWTLEGLPMLGVLGAFLAFHPSRYLPAVLRDARIDRKKLEKMEGGESNCQWPAPREPIQATVYLV